MQRADIAYRHRRERVLRLCRERRALLRKPRAHKLLAFAPKLVQPFGQLDADIRRRRAGERNNEHLVEARAALYLLRDAFYHDGRLAAARARGNNDASFLEYDALLFFGKGHCPSPSAPPRSRLP